MFRKIIKLMLVVFWMGIIYSFSADTGSVSTKKSDGFIIKIVETIKGEQLSEAEKENWIKYLVVPVRKGAHIGVYLILGLLIFNLVVEFFAINYKSILMSIVISFIYACSDEIHQILVPGRSGQITDVFLDTIGASIGILLFLIIYKRCCSNEQKERVS